jgi:hypothetical protein
MATSYRMIIDAGAHYFISVTWEDPDGVSIDMSNYSARMMLRVKYSDSAPLISLTSETGGGIEIDGPAGVLYITMTDEQTALLCGTKEVEGVYDLEVENVDGVVTRLLAGRWIAKPEATK